MKRIYGVFCIGYLLFGICFGIGEINIAYSPYTISQPGAYILVKDLTQSASGDCITISTSGVSIDLNGHGLYGPGTTSLNSGDGISGPIKGPVTITNGQISNFNGMGINLESAQAYVSKVKVTNNTDVGIWIDGGIIENCIVFHNGLNGIVTYNQTYPAIINENEVSYNCWVGDIYPAVYCVQNSKITNNTISKNSCDGVFIPGGNVIISGNVLSSNFGTVGDNSGAGIFVVANNCNIIGNTITNNQTLGIYASSYGNLIKGNNVSSNGYIGILVTSYNRVVNNSVYSNPSGGIVADTGCTIAENDVLNNGPSGILITSNSNNILNNSIFSHTTGLNLSSSGNFWGGNILRGNTISTSIFSNNTPGNGSTGGFNNLVVPYSDINFGIRQFAGFDMSAIQESQNAIFRNLKW